MNRTPFNVLILQVLSLYQLPIEGLPKVENEMYVNKVAERAILIDELVRECGWDVNEFSYLMDDHLSKKSLTFEEEILFNETLV